jgi:hypothetical protein
MKNFILYRLFLIVSAFLCISALQGAPHFTNEDLMYFKHPGKNYVPNGSFELGLGATPIYPGWETDLGHAEPPEKPEIVDDAHTGTKSLRVRKIQPNCQINVYITPPNIEDTYQDRFEVSYWAKSNKPNVHFKCNWWENGRVVKENEVNQWVHAKFVTKPGEIKNKYRTFELIVKSDIEQEYDIQIDDICITNIENPDGNWMQADEVEAVFIPQPRNDSVHFTGDDITLKYAITPYSTARNVRLELHLCDIGRGGSTTYPFELDNLQLTTDSVTEGEIPLGKLKNGAYMALLAVEDATSGTLLSVAKENFTVMYDTMNTPPFVNYTTGSYGCCRGFSTHLEMTYRGYWTTEEYYKTAYLIGRRMNRLMVNPKYTSYFQYAESEELSEIEDTVNEAKKYNTKIMLCVNPITTTDPANSNMTKDSPLAWLAYKGIKIPEAHKFSTDTEFRCTVTHDYLKKYLINIAKRFGKKIDVLELHNELNLALLGEESVQYLFERGYNAFKKILPDVPLLMNQTMDGIYSSEADHFTKMFMTQGGTKFSDGFTFHPYSRSYIYGDYGNGIDYIKLMRHFKEDYAPKGEELLLGQSEILNLGDKGSPGWDIVQRFLLDWAAGCLWSVGIDGDGMYFLEMGDLNPWYFRGSRPPGLAGVASNAMHQILGGHEFLEMVDKDNKILVCLFKKPDNSGYALAMAGGSDPDQCPEITIDLTNLSNLKMYDMCGAEISSNTPFILTRDPIYITSTDQALLERAKDYSFQWVNNNYNYEYMEDRKSADFLFEYLCTGMFPRKK